MGAVNDLSPDDCIHMNTIFLEEKSKLKGRKTQLPDVDVVNCHVGKCEPD